jgi:thiamine monophosphate synthase
MFIIKKYYYLYIENTKDINLNNIKKNKKIIIIYRNKGAKTDIVALIKFSKQCKKKQFKLYIANNLKLANKCKANGVYVSAYNKKIYLNKKLNLIGAAHNYSEINNKIKQGCKTIILSRLFKTSYNYKKSYFGIVKFNLIKKNYSINIVPLGGINAFNLLKLNLVKSDGFALLSEVKKKPAITSRLF